MIWGIVDFLGMLHLRRINVSITYHFYSRLIFSGNIISRWRYLINSEHKTASISCYKLEVHSYSFICREVLMKLKHETIQTIHPHPHSGENCTREKSTPSFVSKLTFIRNCTRIGHKNRKLSFHLNRMFNLRNRINHSSYF